MEEWIFDDIEEIEEEGSAIEGEEPVPDMESDIPEAKIPGGENDAAVLRDTAFKLIAGELGAGDAWVEKVKAMGLDPTKVLEARMDILLGR